MSIILNSSDPGLRVSIEIFNCEKLESSGLGLRHTLVSSLTFVADLAGADFLPMIS